MKAVIVGAGIAGLTLAWWLRKDGWDVIVLEKAAGLRDEGYMIDFFSSGYDVAERMDLLSRLKALSYRIPKIVWVNGKGKRVSHIDYERMASLLGGRVLTLMRGDLERALFDHLPSGIDLRYGCSVSAIQSGQESVDLTLTTGEYLRADLLIGADGVHSTVREMVFGNEKRFIRFLGYHTAAFIFEDARLHSAIADEFQLMCVPNRQAGFYPIRDNRIASFFVHRAATMALPTNPRDEISRVYGDFGWHVPNALKKAEGLKDIYYDQVAQIEMSLWYSGRVTLVGDACQAVSLMAGQGASLAMGGAYILAETLRQSQSVAHALQQYQLRLRTAVLKKQLAGRRTAGWLVPSSSAKLQLRNLFMTMAQLPGMTWLLKATLLSGAESVLPSSR